MNIPVLSFYDSCPTEKHVATLEGHTSRLTSAEFCPHYSATLVTISEDRTFKVWNIDDLTMIYQSPILTASPFITMAMNLLQPQVAIGTADGQIRVFDLADGNGFRQLHHIDVAKIIRKQNEKRNQLESSHQGPVTVSSRPVWQRMDQNELPPPDNMAVEDAAEAGCSVLGLLFTYVPQDNTTAEKDLKIPTFLRHQSTVVKDLLNSSPMLLVGTTGTLMQINAKTLDVCSYIDLQDPIPCEQGLSSETNSVTVTAAGSVYFSQGVDLGQLWCVVCGHFQNVVHLLQWQHVSVIGDITSRLETASIGQGDVGANGGQQLYNDSGGQEQLSTDQLTVLSNVPLAVNSVLRSEMTMKPKDDGKTKKQKGFLTPNKTSLDDQPLTFHSKVKSSGYTASPRTTMFKPQTDFSKKTPSVAKKTSKSSDSFSSLVGKNSDKQYPMNCAPPSSVKQKLNVAERPTPIHSTRFSGDGKLLGCALANKSAQVFSMPLTGKGSSCVGHNHTVSCVNWSHDNNYLITSSDDKTASVWSQGLSEPLMTFSTLSNNLSNDKDGAKIQKPNKENGPFPRDVKFARFYYMDKFVLLTSGSTLYMYKYHLDSAKQDIKRYLSLCKYKQVTSYSLGAQQITAMSAINGFYSYLVFCAGTNKSLEVYDMNVGQVVRTMTDVHTKPAHIIRQHEGSMYTSHPADAYDLFVTAAAGDCIKLWDLRTNRCVHRYEGHLNRVYPCGVDLSPCGRYIATGAEDKSAYIYDIRTGTYCRKLIEHTDVVADVAFHPKYPEMVTASLDGKLTLYSSTSSR